jgi:hypothetical protein
VHPSQTATGPAALAMRGVDARPSAGNKPHQARWGAVAEQAERRAFRASGRAAICGLPRNVAKPVARRGRRPSPRQAVVAAQPAQVDSEVVVAAPQARVDSEVVVAAPQARADLAAAAGLVAVAVAGDGAGERDPDNDHRRRLGLRVLPCSGSGTRCSGSGTRSCRARHGCAPE